MYYDDFYFVKLSRLAGDACADCWQVGSGVPSRRKAALRGFLFYVSLISSSLKACPGILTSQHWVAALLWL